MTPASFASAERMEGSLADELELIGNAEVRRGGAVFTADRTPIDMTLMK